jgi:cytoskeleton protein RodZ
MSSLGPYLRELRERRGVSLEELARTTRVGRAYLEALEAGDFSGLPAPVFTRGFILAYCQALDASPDEAIARYTGRIATPEPAAAAATATRDAARGRGPVLVSFALLVVLGAALFAVSQVLQAGRAGPVAPVADRSRDEPRPPGESAPTGLAAPPATSPTAAPTDGPPESPPAAVAQSAPASAKRPVPSREVVAAVASPVPTVSQQEITAALSSVSAPYRLIARATAPTWLRVRTDDGRQVDETIPAGQAREWVSNRPFTLTIGNAGGLTLEVNGRTLPTLGAPGAVITRLVVPSETP